MERINIFLKKLFYGTVALGAVSTQWILFFMAFVMLYDVVMRYVFNLPTVWAQETCEYMMVFLTFIGLAETQKQKAPPPPVQEPVTAPPPPGGGTNVQSLSDVELIKRLDENPADDALFNETLRRQGAK